MQAKELARVVPIFNIVFDNIAENIAPEIIRSENDGSIFICPALVSYRKW
jgi:hypothetical protein